LHFGPIACQGPSIDATMGDYDFAVTNLFGDR
jgi:hypothetical protein